MKKSERNHKESSGRSRSPGLTFDEQRNRQKAIDEIESSGFNPAMFMSSRSQVSDCNSKQTKL